MGQPRKAAPGGLEPIRLFVNTLNVETGRDHLDEPQKLEDWLRERGLLTAREHASATDLRRVIAVREALRALLLANAGREASREAAETLNSAAERAGLGIRFAEDGSSRVEPAASGVDGALGRLLAMVAAAMADGSWSRLKACREETCRWAFYDHTRNRSGIWCDMAVCGNRTKVRAYRRRHSSDGQR